jgi:hypothetical protein
MIERLVSRWEEGYEVVSALVPFRGWVRGQTMRPFQPLGWRLETDDLSRVTDDSDAWVALDPADGAMQRVDFIGSGVLMLHRGHLLGLNKPWWSYTVNPETMQREASMDSQFVWRLKTELNAEVWCDTTIEVTHIHDFEIDKTFQYRFEDWAQTGGDPTICQPPAGR